MNSEFSASLQKDDTGLFWDSWSPEAEVFLEKNAFKNAEFIGDWGDFSFFSRCGKSIKSLDIGNNTSKRIDGLISLSQLENLNLGFKNKGVFDFSNLPSLKRLQLKSTNQDQDITVFRHPALLKLCIDNLKEIDTPVENDRLKYLELVRPRVSSLKFFENFGGLSGVEIHRSSFFESLGGAPDTLKSIHVEFCRKLKDLSRIVEIRQLNILMLIASWQSTEFPQEVYSCTQLKRLAITETPLIIDWEKIFTMKNLDLICLISHDRGPSDDEFLGLASINNRKILAIERQGPEKEPMIFIRLKEPDGTMNSDKLLDLYRS